MTPRDNWTDDRLDAFYDEFKRMMVLVERIGIIETDLGYAARDAAACRKNVHDLRSDMAAAAIRAAQERKSDKRWYIGTILTATAILIAAVGIIVGAIS